ncbi:DUF3303 family protein [Accumulibacter sp.]|uniref:DUF3303 family protein n=1 Tax=Candidatus Accumulibacter proximus TaxID=2954385 RepID=A0A935UG44_9PROT|nr:DUF3303 family protein [Accumulibacter sp.]MBK7675277.1 DUF3303 family protein [Candidatus Accumulibacter proximus]MBL8374173.1 DUF3303 family protein [Accumulibacter sp.]MBP6709291.1 DUF3303 family protein [Accumulibacter sp.]
MFYMLINRTRPGLTADDFAQLGKLAQGFYDGIPPGLVLHNDWAANDGSRTFALLETDDPALLEQIQAPFRPYVDMELVPVTPVTGWTK